MARGNFGFTGSLTLSQGLIPKGSWDANANVPFLQSGVGTVGDFYIVSVAGNTNLDGNNVWNLGDWALFTDTNVWVRIANPSGTAYNQIQEEGVNLAQRTILDFQGDLLTATDNGAKTVVTVAYTTSAKTYGSFYDTTTQTSVANQQTPMKLNSTDFSNGISIVNDILGNPTLIRVTKNAVYNVQFSAQLLRTSGGQVERAYIWLSKNGLYVPETNTVISLANNGSLAVAAWNFYVQLNAGEDIQLMWLNTLGTIELHRNVPNVFIPPIPEIPSLILTISEI
jgi:hypothetical protein